MIKLIYRGIICFLHTRQIICHSNHYLWETYNKHKTKLIPTTIIMYNETQSAAATTMASNRSFYNIISVLDLLTYIVFLCYSLICI